MEQDLNILKGTSFEQLAQNILTVDNALHSVAVKSINQTATIRNWIIGGYIVEYEQHGSDRARYGNSVIERLVKSLSDKRLNNTLLKNSRSFYLNYSSIKSYVEKSPTLSDKSLLPGLPMEITESLIKNKWMEKSPTLSDEFVTPPEKLLSSLSFSHIVELLTISDSLVRFFYENECIKGTWSVRELRRQIASNLHIRIGLSRDKLKAMVQANTKAEQQSTALQIRDPYTFEFLGLKSKDVFSEGDLEEALITHLQDFLLELGKGFCFEARQKRMIIDGEYYFADLVFYNRLLHCNVIVELKNDEFRHEHIGQLNAYVGYYAENEMQLGDNPPIGILLCTRKGLKMVEYALGSMDNRLFVSSYQLKLPNRKELEQFIIDECQNHQLKK